MPDNTQTKIDIQLTTLAQNDVFQLVGIKELAAEKKLELLAKMQELLINDFFVNDLPKLLSESEIKEFEAMNDNKTPPDKVAQALKTKVPDIEDRMYEKSMDFKQKFVIAQLEQNAQVLEKKIEMLKAGTFPADKIPNGNANEELLRVNKEKVKIRMVIQHYKTGQWAEGLAILNTGN